MVRRWSAYIHPRLVWGQVCGSCTHHLGRSGAQVGSLQEETELEIKDRPGIDQECIKKWSENMHALWRERML